MIGFDTNVLVRYIRHDDATQSVRATTLLESLTADAPGFVPLIAVVELAQVLASAYDLDRGQLVQVFETLLRTKELIVEDAAMLWQALRIFARSSADFADCLIERSAATAGCERTVTFDRAAAKGCGMTLLA